VVACWGLWGPWTIPKGDRATDQRAARCPPGPGRRRMLLLCEPYSAEELDRA
jgi:hypothetical protein